MSYTSVDQYARAGGRFHTILVCAVVAALFALFALQVTAPSGYWPFVAVIAAALFLGATSVLGYNLATETAASALQREVLAYRSECDIFLVAPETVTYLRAWPTLLVCNPTSIEVHITPLRWWGRPGVDVQIRTPGGFVLRQAAVVCADEPVDPAAGEQDSDAASRVPESAKIALSAGGSRALGLWAAVLGVGVFGWVVYTLPAQARWSVDTLRTATLLTVVVLVPWVVWVVGYTRHRLARATQARALELITAQPTLTPPPRSAPGFTLFLGALPSPLSSPGGGMLFSTSVGERNNESCVVVNVQTREGTTTDYLYGTPRATPAG